MANRNPIALALLSVLALSLPVWASPTVPVLIVGASDLPELTVLGARLSAVAQGSAHAGATLPMSTPLTVRATGHGLEVRRGDQPAQIVHRLTIAPQSNALTLQWGTAHKAVAAPVTISLRKGRLWVVADIAEDTYLGGVLAGEITPSAPWEALKAQAIVARSFLYQSRERHGVHQALVCDQSHCQRMVAASAVALALRKAVSDTAGLVVTGAHDTPVPVYYHASCGGTTTAVRQVFGGPDWAHLRGVADPVCATEPGWTVSQPLGACLAALTKSKLFVPAGATDFTVTDRSGTGWPITVSVAAPLPKQLDAYTVWLAFGAAWGWGKVPGLHYDLHREGDVVLITGRGLGHGIGLCQRGMMGRAAMGHKAATILAHYFPGTRVHAR
ncbi:MAG: hypothetical protein H7338_07500 [Candidatus Sericytochromatia bacterium]|nr:hypothetical protein [Candidatus Sericytochromatia bacterium]